MNAFWSLIDLATGVTGLLDSDHIDLSDLANNSDFIDYLIGNSYFTTSLTNDSNFLTNLTTNLNTSGLLSVVTDGVTITGNGTTGSPLVATGGGSSSLEVEEDGVSIETGVTKINFTNGPIVTNPVAGEVDVDFSALLGAGGGTLLASDTTQSTITNSSNAYTTRYTIQIPGGTLGTENVLRVSLLNTSFSGSSGSGDYGILVKYGGVTVAEITDNNTGVLNPNQYLDIVGIIAANNSTGSQKSVFTATNEYVVKTDGSSSISVDSTINQDLTIETKGQNGGSMTQTIEGIIVEKITTSGSTNYISDSLTAGQDITAFTAGVIGDGSGNIIAQQTFSGIGVSFPVDMSTEKVSTQIDTSADYFVLSGFTFSNRGVSGAATGNIKVSLQTNNLGEASGTILTSATIPFSTVPSLGSNTVTFTTPYTLSPSTTYWVVIEGVTASGIIDFSTALNAAATRHFYTGGVWTNSAYYIGSSLLTTFEGGKIYTATNSTGLGTFQQVPGFGGNAITTPSLMNKLDGIILTTAVTGAPTTLVTEGYLSGFTGLTPGGIYQVGTNGVPTLSGGKQIGKAISSTKMLIRQNSY